MSEKKVMFSDTTLRDGAQSLWAMNIDYGKFDAVAEPLDQAGYDYIDLPMHAIYFKMAVRFLKEDPWQSAHLLKKKITKTKKMIGILDTFNFLEEAQPKSVVRMFYEVAARVTGIKRFYYMCNSRNELERYYPWVVPIARDLGLEFSPCICYYPSPRTSDDYYADLAKRLMAFKPDALWLKDAGGLLTVERIKTLLPAIQKEAKGVPIELHTHGMSTNHGRVVVKAMQLGVDGIHTCIPPLASGSSHVSIFNAMHNARVLGLEHNISNVEVLQVIEERLRRIGKLEDLPIGVPLEYDHAVYSHQIPGGVISNLKTQLAQMGISHKLDEVLDEVVRIIEDLGYPIMVTPGSQFIVSQAAVNVATGERYKEILDCMIETALGVWGWEDAGVPWMNPDVKDRFLSHPNARRLAEKYERKQEIMDEGGAVQRLRKSYGMTHASDEDFLLYHIMKGDTEINKIEPTKTYYTGKEPLLLLLKELSKHNDISRLQMQTGNSFFEFRQKPKSWLKDPRIQGV